MRGKLPQAVRSPPIENWITLALLATLVAGCYLVLAPFLSAVLWAIVLCCTTWPAFRWLVRAMKGRSGLAAAATTLIIAVVLLAPLAIVVLTLADNANELLQSGRGLIEQGVPGLPGWVERLPLVGPRLSAYWTMITTEGASGILSELSRYIIPLREFALSGGAAFGHGILQITLSIFIAFFLYRDGAAASEHLHMWARRIAGERGEPLLLIADNTMRNVVYGVLGTALAQGTLAAIGLWMAGVPAAPLLGLLTFFLSPIPIGPPLVWVPAAIWLFYHDSPGWAVFMLIWGFAAVSSIDNVIRPLIISRGSNLPFVLVLLGILGGVVAFGVIGIFLGPTLLAIAYSLVSEWNEIDKPVHTGRT